MPVDACRLQMPVDSCRCLQMAQVSAARGDDQVWGRGDGSCLLHGLWRCLKRHYDDDDDNGQFDADECAMFCRRRNGKRLLQEVQELTEGVQRGYRESCLAIGTVPQCV